MIPKILLNLLTTAMLLAPCAMQAETVAETRAALVEAASEGACTMEMLQKALSPENDPILRRTAVRLLAEQGEEATALLQELTLQDPDSLVCQNALLALRQREGSKLDAAFLARCLNSEKTAVRLLAADFYFSPPALTPERPLLAQTLLKTEKDKKMRQLLTQAIWPFHRKNVLLKDRKDWDHEVTMTAEHPLPLDGWKFQLDPAADLHLGNGCHRKEFDDSQWMDIAIGKSWEEQGHQYDGYAWYRSTFQAPERPEKFNAAELHFEGVDECAWVWLNGVFIGDHDLGADGWNIPFSLDVTEEIRWGEPNQVTIRVRDDAFAGGIYLPIQLQIME
ncbi:MAG: HEAT repeat domain-containing protein [Lentisphaeria bacterium]|nr:HEAT repeat domain-containing protein [Lentisphaeria bacterium]